MNRTCRQKNREERQQRQGKAGLLQVGKGTERSREGEGEADRQGGAGGGESEGVEEAKADNSGKIKGSRAGGVENGRNKPVVPTVWTAGRRIRWRVLEVTPDPLASADICFSIK